MASLTLEKWTRYEPSIPGNADLPKAERFFLEVRTAMTVVEWDAFATKQAAAATLDDRRALIASVSRLGSVPLTLDGKPVATLEQYLDLVVNEQRGMPLALELVQRINYANSFEGAFELFCERPSGGSGGTPESTTGKAGSQTAAP